MKMLAYVLSFLVTMHDVAYGKPVTEIRCIVSLAQQTSPDGKTYSVESTQRPIVTEYDSEEGIKTVLLVAKEAGQINPRIPRYELRNAEVGEMPTVTIVFTYGNTKPVGPSVGIEMSSDFGVTTSVGFKETDNVYVQGVMTKLDSKYLGLVSLTCLKAD